MPWTRSDSACINTAFSFAASPPSAMRTVRSGSCSGCISPDREHHVVHDPITARAVESPHLGQAGVDDVGERTARAVKSDANGLFPDAEAVRGLRGIELEHVAQQEDAAKPVG